MNRQLIIKMAVAAGVVTGLGMAANAHHSGAMFDPEKTITIKGVVKEFEYTNPHSWLWVTVTNEDKTTTDWGFEAEGPSTLFRNGRPAAAWVNAVKDEDGRVLTPRLAPPPVTTVPAAPATTN
jgi:Family of unknown function (DUF6152)